MSSSDIDLVILDFDGVLTDNRVYVMEDGREAVACHRGDDWGIGMLKQAAVRRQTIWHQWGRFLRDTFLPAASPV